MAVEILDCTKSIYVSFKKSSWQKKALIIASSLYTIIGFVIFVIGCGDMGHMDESITELSHKIRNETDSQDEIKIANDILEDIDYTLFVEFGVGLFCCVLGVVIMILTSLTFFGIKWESRCLLILIIILLTVSTLSQILLGGLFVATTLATSTISLTSDTNINLKNTENANTLEKMDAYLKQFQELQATLESEIKILDDYSKKLHNFSSLQYFNNISEHFDTNTKWGDDLNIPKLRKDVEEILSVNNTVATVLEHISDKHNCPKQEDYRLLDVECELVIVLEVYQDINYGITADILSIVSNIILGILILLLVIKLKKYRPNSNAVVYDRMGQELTERNSRMN